MRIIHTSDWHLGKRLFKLDRIQEHKLFLDWLVSTLVDRKIDLLLISGDIFDTPMPPHQALEMFYEFLSRVSHETKAETLIIAGNHDSGLLLEAPQELLREHRVKVWGKLSSDVNHHWYKFRELEICAIPFFRSHELLPQGDGDAVAALKTYLDRKKTGPQLLMLHHLAGMFEAAGSEQVISLSGVDSIPSELLKNFDYVALGHIHKPQKISEKAYYSGSPIPLRFSETLRKSVVILDDLRPEIVPIPLTRALISIKATEENWREKIRSLSVTSELTPMVEMQLTLSSPRIGLIDEIKAALSEKGMELLSFLPSFESLQEDHPKSSKLFDLSTTDLFKEFYATKFPLEPQVPEDLMQDFAQLLEKVKNASYPTQD